MKSLLNLDLCEKHKKKEDFPLKDIHVAFVSIFYYFSCYFLTFLINNLIDKKTPQNFANSNNPPNPIPTPVCNNKAMWTLFSYMCNITTRRKTSIGFGYSIMR